MKIAKIFTLSDVGFYVSFPFPEKEKKILMNAITSIKIPPKQTEIQKHLDEKMSSVLRGKGYFSEYMKDKECFIWHPDFKNSVDLFNPKDKIAVEIEKSEAKKIVHSILKLINASQTFVPKIKFGVLITPDKYIYGKSLQNWISKINKDVLFYFSGIINDSNLNDILFICYKVESK